MELHVKVQKNRKGNDENKTVMAQTKTTEKNIEPEVIKVETAVTKI